MSIAAAAVFYFAAAPNLTQQGLYYDELHQATGAFAYIGEDPEMANIYIRTYPNPFVGHITFEYRLNSGAEACLEIYSPDGKRLNSYSCDHASAGTYRFQWNGSGFPDGIYIYRLRVTDDSGIDMIQAKIIKAAR